MKKLFATVLALCMILSICSFQISADTLGTPITNEAEFLAMKEDGYYYLANDITVTKSYEKFFTGVFDGNGKTVTVTGEPMFWEFCGKAKDLTINGEVVADHAKDNGYWARGAFACMVSGEGTITLYNITNNANVKGFETQDSAYALLGNAYTGGIIGALDNKSVGTNASIEIINCVNNGTVSGWHCTGGITGILYVNDSAYLGEQTCVVTNCTNNGTVTGLGEYAGGMVGRVYYAVDATFTGCINNGDITGFGNTGGIIGHTTNSNTIMRVCQNNGNISTSTAEGCTAYAGGLIGYGQGTKDSTRSAEYGYYANQIEFCINTGNVTSIRRTGGIIGSTGASGAFGISHTRYCINTGNVTNLGTGSTAHSHGCAGGIQGYGYGSGLTEYAYVTDCISVGNVDSQHAEFGIASYVIGYISSEHATLINNRGSGVLTSAANKALCLGWNNNTLGFTDESTGNLFPATNTYPIAADASMDTCKGYVVGTFDETVLLSGEAIAAFNEAYKKLNNTTSDCMSQKLDATFNPQIIVLEAAAPEFPAPSTEPETTPAPETTKAPEPETTPAPETTAEPEQTAEATEPAAPEQTNAPAVTEPAEEKGCGGFVAGGIALVAILGTALIIKKKD